VSTVLFLALSGCDRSASEWEATKQERSVEAIKVFVDKHPHGQQIEEARALLAVVQQEEAKWHEASKDGSLRVLHGYCVAFPNSRFRSSAEERKAKAIDAFKPDNVMIIMKAADGSGTLLGIWHGQVEFALSGNFIPNFVPPDPTKKNLVATRISTITSGCARMRCSGCWRASSMSHSPARAR
jgi:hypothetical protein